MSASQSRSLAIPVDGAGTVSALLIAPPQARACFVFAHGAGAGMTHVFMNDAAESLAARGIATLRFQFPYLEKGSKRPDSPAVAQATVRAAVAEAARLCPGLRLIAGGKSFGARMTSQAQSAAPLPGVTGLVFFGFPLHPAGQPAVTRADHLDAVEIPMLFLQGTRDKLAEMELLEPVVQRLGRRATLHRIEQADHAFHVPARSGRNARAVMDELTQAFAVWCDALPGA
ncbi:dienelactone hydrolase family protein [Bradyrhizobium ontarionense]|uniref:Dienelactone hydrolase family protein n=1 Tax=Bradyrhizobium ontarionense TaxID=2898149 RepID=A0ABY3R5T3_9BRAD|nr:alpha/beta family hydrolase [Bradyrhizobium sp. A19]UFZ02494.1 dienelactone hydrolase family protein [Bradyrhizobium sp. A19]